MRHLALRDQTWPVIQALQNSLSNPEALDQWLRRYWVVVPDPLGFEYVRSPQRQIVDASRIGGQLRGDCDDAATLAACILSAMGWPCRFVAIRQRPDPEFSHVFVRCPALPYASAGSPFQLDIDPIVPAGQLPLRGDFELMEMWV